MKLALLFGFIAGFAGVLAGGYYLPLWGEHERVPAMTSVQANGGRLEAFVIQLPADRIEPAGPRPGAMTAPVDLPAPLSEQPLLLEHFKVRDAEGHVVGVAARHRTATAEGSAATWWVVIPGRGAMLLTGRETPDALTEALAAAGWRQGAVWRGEVEIARTDAEGSRIVSGSREFARLEGSYTESVRVTGVSEDGELQGTIRLATVTYVGGA